MLRKNKTTLTRISNDAFCQHVQEVFATLASTDSVSFIVLEKKLNEARRLVLEDGFNKDAPTMVLATAPPMATLPPTSQMVDEFSSELKGAAVADEGLPTDLLLECSICVGVRNRSTDALFVGHNRKVAFQTVPISHHLWVHHSPKQSKWECRNLKSYIQIVPTSWQPHHQIDESSRWRCYKLFKSTGFLIGGCHVCLNAFLFFSEPIKHHCRVTRKVNISKRRNTISSKTWQPFNKTVYVIILFLCATIF